MKIFVRVHLVSDGGPVVRRLRRGWSVSDGTLLVVAVTRQEAVRQFDRLKAADEGRVWRPRCAAEGCDRHSVAIFNVVWLCAEHCSAALSELRSLGMRRPVEFTGDVSLFVQRAPTDE